MLNVPNLLTLSRLPLSALLFVCIALQWWVPGLVVFIVAALTDWLDGWWARRFRQTSDFGRNFDPLIDKIMIGGAFTFLLPYPNSGLVPWMVTVVISREFLITGLRSYMEQQGHQFGADFLGKLKMVLQCVLLVWILVHFSLRSNDVLTSVFDSLELGQTIVLYSMLTITILSALQYVWKAWTKLQAGLQDQTESRANLSD